MTTMTKNRIVHLGWIGAAALALSCGGSTGTTISLARYAATSEGGEAAWKGLLPGNRYVLHAPAGSCKVSAAASLGELEKGGGTPLAGTPAGARMRVIEVVNGYVRTGNDAFVALEVRDESGSTTWLKLPSGSAQGCLQPVPRDIVAARKLLKQRLVFTPWATDCTEIQAVGRTPSAMLIDAEGDVAFEVESLSMGPDSAQAMAANKPGSRLWAVMANQTLKVRADLVSKCFSEPGSDAAKRPGDPLALLRLPAARCEKSDDEGKAHVECRTTLGLWEGVSTDSALELRATRRTIGPAHFLDGKLVKGDRYARTVVSVALGSAADPRRQRLYAELTPAVRAAMSRDGGSVRVADPGSPDVTYKIAVELGEIGIGELKTQEIPQTSKYKVRDDIKPNPDKPKAKQRVADAKTKLSTAESEYQTNKQQFDQQKKQLIDECNAQAAKAEGWAKLAAATGCAAADALVQPSDSAVVAARTELTNAETELAKMPDTITVPVMADHAYVKKVYARGVRGEIKITLEPVGAAPRTFPTPLEYNWEDAEVIEDLAHNVKGDPVDRGPIDNPEALVPYIATAASSAITTRFRAAMAEAQIEAARKAMAAAGMEASKPGFETVDALAFDVVGTRLERPLLRGASALVAGKVVPLPSEALSLGADQCLLAVAAGATDAALQLSLKSKDRSHGDLRDGGFAMVELCQTELKLGKVPALELSSKANGDVKWTLYRVRAANGGGS